MSIYNCKEKQKTKAANELFYLSPEALAAEIAFLSSEEFEGCVYAEADGLADECFCTEGDESFTEEFTENFD